jgi:hypothetical protein
VHPSALRVLLVVSTFVFGCGARTELPGQAMSGAGSTGGDGGPPACGSPPSASVTGFFNAGLCTPPTSCDDVGNAHVCPCAGAPSPNTCFFDAIHDDGHIFTAQCDTSTGACLCTIDGARCTCQNFTQPEPLCVLDSALNCCF